MSGNKFKIWDKKNKKLYLDFVIDQHGILWRITEDGDLHPPVQDQYVVLWYTGKRDKNNKEIYAGDLLQTYTGDRKTSITVEVVWQRLSWQLRPILTRGLVRAWTFDTRNLAHEHKVNDGRNLANYESENLEVIGNVHEGKE